MREIEAITPPPLPFSLDAKIFNLTDDEGNVVGAPYSYNDWMHKIESISGVNSELMGPAND